MNNRFSKRLSFKNKVERTGKMAPCIKSMLESMKTRFRSLESTNVPVTSSAHSLLQYSEGTDKMPGLYPPRWCLVSAQGADLVNTQHFSESL